MASSSGPATGPNDRVTPSAQVPTTYWVAHLALILAAAAAAVILARRGESNLLRESSIVALILLVLLFLAQLVIARRAGGALGNGTAYALCAAGALCMLAAQFAATESLLIGLTILCALFFVSGIVAFVIIVRRAHAG